jgi:magnesium-transporting ATPase (P-type)
MPTDSFKEDPRLISFNTLRKTIGWLGILLPLSLLLACLIFSDCHYMQDSISHYYYTVGGGLFVGTLCAVAMFLIAYRGYPGDKDRILTTLAGIFALGIAFFPTNDNSSHSCAVLHLPDSDTRRIIHYTCATIFFILLALISYFFFTRSKGTKSKQKAMRNTIYRTCAIIIFIAIALIAAYGIFGKHLHSIDQYHPIFWLEWCALLAFGASWLVKGELVLKDKPE